MRQRVREGINFQATMWVSYFSLRPSNFICRIFLPCVGLILLGTECKGLTVTAVKDLLQMKIKAKVACTCEGDHQPNVLISSLDFYSQKKKKKVCFLNNDGVCHFCHDFFSRTPRHFVICLFGGKERDKNINISQCDQPPQFDYFQYWKFYGIPGSPPSRANRDDWPPQMSPNVKCRISEFQGDIVPWTGGKRTCYCCFLNLYNIFSC